MIPDVLYHTLYVIGGTLAGGLALALVILLVLVNEMRKERYEQPPPDVSRGLDADPREQMVSDVPVPPDCGQEEIDLDIFEHRRN